MTSPRRTVPAHGVTPPHGLALSTASALSLWAALVHAWEAPSHFLAGTVYGAFFLAVALAQAAYGLALRRWPHPAVLLAGIAGNLTVLGAYLLSRTVGVPIGPHAGAIDAAGALDWFTAVVEVALIVALTVSLRDRPRTLATNTLVLVGVLGWSARLTGVLG